MVKLNSKKLEDILWLLNGLALLFPLNQLSTQSFFRFDLTEEKRYTISNATKELLRNLEDPVYIDVYLEGDFPAGFKRLQKGIRETLKEFESYSSGMLRFTFIDPSQAVKKSDRNRFYQSLAAKGVQPTNLFANENGKKIEKIIFPGAVVSYAGQEQGVLLLKGNKATSPQEQLNQSIENVEFELAYAIKTLTQKETPKIGLVKGHLEIDSAQIYGLKNELKKRYEVINIQLQNQSYINSFSALIIAKPQSVFSEAEKFFIDQYIMKGGKVLFFLDVLEAKMDSASGEGTFAFPYNLNLGDLLFKYGTRINNNFVKDLNSGAYPVITGQLGNQPQIRLMPWPFFPILNTFGNHPMVKNLDAIYGRFVSTIDTVKADGIKKTPLIFSSKHSKIVAAPVRVSVNDLRENDDRKLYNNQSQIVACLLEGSFQSLYQYKFPPRELSKAPKINQGKNTKILVVADGDILKSAINPRSGQPQALGFDPLTQTQYANGDFIRNALEYLLDDQGLIGAKKKDIKIRPLDKVAIEESELFWKTLNLALPLILLIALGILKWWLRKRAYTSE